MIEYPYKVGQVIGPYTITKAVYGDRWVFTGECSKGHSKNFREKSISRELLCQRCVQIQHSGYDKATHNSFTSMVERCYNPDNLAYTEYGEIGIEVCDEWNPKRGGSYYNFVQWMGKRPEGKTLDRYPDKAGNYEPGNVRWASYSEQGYNQKTKNTNTSGKTGVTWQNARSKWRAYIYHDGLNIHLGYFELFEDAVQARELAEIKYFGELKHG